MIEPDGPDTCIVTAGADDLQRIVLHLAAPGLPFEVLEPAEVAEAAAAVADLLTRASGRT
jgi:hypothetical protein